MYYANVATITVYSTSKVLVDSGLHGLPFMSFLMYYKQAMTEYKFASRRVIKWKHTQQGEVVVFFLH